MSGMSTATAVSLAVSLASTAVGAYASYQQADQQQRQQKESAEYQAAIAQQNQDLADEQARAQRKEGYDAAVKKRQETAVLIGKQRALAGGSGAQVDTGNFLDLNMDTAEKGEFDALNAYQSGLNAAYNTEIQKWNYGNQAEGYRYQASQAASRDPWAAAGATALNGLAAIGSGFGENLWGVAPKGGGSTMSDLVAKGVSAANKGAAYIKG